MGYANTEPQRQSQELRNRQESRVKSCSSAPSVVPENRLCDSKLNVQHLITLIFVEKN